MTLLIGGVLCFVGGLLNPAPLSWQGTLSLVVYTFGALMLLDGLRALL